MQEPEQEEKESLKKKWLKRLWLWLWRFALYTFTLFISLALLFQIPPVQNWAVRQVTKSLSKQLETKVSVDYLRFAWFDRLQLDHFWVQDYDGDTLVYSSQLRANFNLNPITLILKGIEIEALDLKGAQFNLQRLEGEMKTNIQIAAERLSPTDTSGVHKKKRPVRLNLKRLGLEDVRFLEDDFIKGKKIAIQLAQGRIEVDQMDLPNKRIAIAGAKINGLDVDVETLIAQDSLWQILDEQRTARLKNTPVDSTKFLLAIEDLDLTGGQVHLHNYRKSPVKISPPDELDYEHLEIYDIDLAAECFSVSDWHFYGTAVNLSAKEQSGFELTNLAIRDASVTPKQVSLYDFLLETPDSRLGDTLILKYDHYRDWISSFVDEVKIEGRLNKVRLMLKDIIAFAPALKKNSFFANNEKETIIFDALITGEVNNLSGKNLSLQFSNSITKVKGRSDFRNLTVPGAQFMNLRLDYLISDIPTLRQLIPDFNPPDNFNRLGRINFKGSFVGLFVDFLADGNLRTSIGQALIDDIGMDLKRGREYAKYSGKLKLIDFDLGAWTKNDDLGTITLSSELKEGVGLTAETATADVNANIESFIYKGYVYENANMSGRLYENFFNGNFAIQDDNVDFGFIGIVDFTDSLPRFDFDSEVKKLDLKQLNLSPRNLVLKGDINLYLRNASLSNLIGAVEVSDFTITENDTAVYRLDTLYADSDIDTLGNKVFTARSDIFDVKIEGLFDIPQVPDVFIQYLNRNFPAYVRQWNLELKDKKLQESDFEYKFEIIDTRKFNRLLNAKLGDIKGAKAEGRYSSQIDEIKIELDIPKLSYDKIEWNDIFISLEGKGAEGELRLGVASTLINKKQELPRIFLETYFFQDTIDFGLGYESDGSYLDNLSLNGRLYILDSTYYKVQFEQSNLVILENLWVIEENNSIVFGDQYVKPENFALTNGDRKIYLERKGKRGLELILRNFDFDFIEEYWDYEPLNFSGKFDVFAELNDLYSLSDFQARVLADTMFINKDDWGVFQMKLNAADFKRPLSAYINLEKADSHQQLIADGYLNLADLREGFQGRALPDYRKAGFFDFDLDIVNYPFELMEYFLGKTIENAKGKINAQLTLSGRPKQPKIGGQLHIADGAVTISYLKTRYRFQEVNIQADSTYFNASGNTILDKHNNKAYLFGGIRHDYLKDFRFDARLNTANFLGVDTKKGDNKMFYGHALGKGDIRFTGSFKQPNIYVNASVGEGTKIVIPVTYEREASDLKFINFVDKDAVNPGEESKGEPADLTGLSLEMDLSVREEADMEIVFDEQAGDILKGNGNGNIRILMPRGGDDFQMFGDYLIEKGDYLFTLYGVVSKDFRIKRGGTIQWNGDPFGAEINIDAEYKDLSTAVYNFIQEYLGASSAGDNVRSQNILKEANLATNVDLNMELTGPLLQPVINFDIAFPELTGQLKSYTDSKLRILKQDPNELNRQVFGLIVVGQFISSDLMSLQGSEIIYNTVSEFVSNQLSLLLTELFSEFIADGRVLSGIDFDIAYNQYQAANLGNEDELGRAEEVEVTLKQDFFNDRLTIMVGGNVATRTYSDVSGAFGNDVVLEYIISQKDRSVKLRVYQRLEPNITGRRLQVGTGISFRKEFDSFSEFLQSFKRRAKDALQGGS